MGFPVEFGELPIIEFGWLYVISVVQSSYTRAIQRFSDTTTQPSPYPLNLFVAMV